MLANKIPERLLAEVKKICAITHDEQYYKMLEQYIYLKKNKFTGYVKWNWHTGEIKSKNTFTTDEVIV